jgi:hypothetical protein
LNKREIIRERSEQEVKEVKNREVTAGRRKTKI